LPEPTSIAWYEHNASAVAARYESVTFEQVHDWLISVLPDQPGLILDVGAGTGRDAAWLAAHGHEVVAVEPSAAMRAEGEARHPDPRIRSIPDRLPGLEQTFRLGLSFDFTLFQLRILQPLPQQAFISPFIPWSRLDLPDSQPE